jgi:hypothetical protein
VHAEETEEGEEGKHGLFGWGGEWDAVRLAVVQGGLAIARSSTLASPTSPRPMAPPPLPPPRVSKVSAAKREPRVSEASAAKREAALGGDDVAGGAHRSSVGGTGNASVSGLESVAGGGWRWLASEGATREDALVELWPALADDRELR